MKLQVVAQVIRDLKGVIPESFRTQVAHRMMNGFLNSLPHDKRNTENEAILTENFNQACELTSDLPFVPHNMQLSDSDLAKFCNRWMAIEKYKDDNGEWQPFSAEMHQVRYTMVKELEAMSNVSRAPRYDEQPETD